MHYNLNVSDFDISFLLILEKTLDWGFGVLTSMGNLIAKAACLAICSFDQFSRQLRVLRQKHQNNLNDSGIKTLHRLAIFAGKG